MAVTHVVDENTTRTARTDYDLDDRSCQTVLHESVNGEQPTSLYKTLLKYDKLNNLTQFAEDIQTEIHTTGYTYDRDNRVTEIAYDGSTHKVKYTYDALGRVATRVAECGATAGKLTSTYGYVGGGYGTNSTTPLVASITQEGVALSYAYDNRSNITSETRNGLTTTYVYDALGQLVRVNDPHEDATLVFNYDRGGNITSKVCYAYTTGTLGAVVDTVLFSYNDSNWKDKLTGYNGRTFEYDAIGNPTSDGVWSYEWEVGRRLKSMSAEGTALSFKYDHNGLRTQKVVQQDWYPTTYSYLYHNEMLTHLTISYTDFDEVEQKDCLHFFYDSQIRPAKVSFNGVVYTYIHNLQGDIVGLLDNTGELVVEYKYDAWGKLLSTTGTLADTLGKHNPFRYRGYVYDEESGLYCLQKRYYSPLLTRFVSADEPSVLEEDYEDILHNNLYTYCENNPIANFDPTGEAAINAVLAVIFGVAGFAVGDFVAKGLGYSRGWKYWAIRSAVAVGGAVLGWFSPRLIGKILAKYVTKNPTIIMKLASKYGGKTVVKTLSTLGVNPVKVFNSSKLMGFMLQIFNKAPKLKMPDSWVKALYKVINKYGWSIRLDPPHDNNWNVWHIHIKNCHIAVSDKIVNFLKRLGY